MECLPPIVPLVVEILQHIFWVDLTVLCLNAKFDINSCKKNLPPQTFLASCPTPPCWARCVLVGGEVVPGAPYIAATFQVNWCETMAMV